MGSNFIAAYAGQFALHTVRAMTNKRTQTRRFDPSLKRSPIDCHLYMVTSTQVSSSSGQPKSPSPKSSLGKHLKGWPKKREKLQPNETPIIAKTSATRSEEYPVIDPLVLQNANKETRWAVIWLSRLQPRRKKSRKNDNLGAQSEKIQTTIMTLAEQLQEAQSTPLTVPNSKVLPSPMIIAN